MHYKQDSSFSAKERMKLRKHIDTLFQNGKAFSIYPFRIIHLSAENSKIVQSPVRMGISVPKKKLSKAHQRNLVKRRAKEAWRINKKFLYAELNDIESEIHCFLIYQPNKILDFDILESSIKKIQLHLINLYQKPIRS